MEENTKKYIGNEMLKKTDTQMQKCYFTRVTRWAEMMLNWVNVHSVYKQDVIYFVVAVVVIAAAVFAVQCFSLDRNFLSRAISLSRQVGVYAVTFADCRCVSLFAKYVLCVV